MNLESKPGFIFTYQPHRFNAIPVIKILHGRPASAIGLPYLPTCQPYFLRRQDNGGNRAQPPLQLNRNLATSR